jgi:hypothetical protein
MADILSLSKARKARARTAKETTAAENRVRFGRTKAQKGKDAAEQSRAAKKADAHKREP